MICVVRNSDGHVAFEAVTHSHPRKREKLFRVCMCALLLALCRFSKIVCKGTFATITSADTICANRFMPLIGLNTNNIGKSIGEAFSN